MSARMLGRDDVPYLKQSCQEISTYQPGLIVLGIFIFGFAHVDTTSELMAHQVRGNPFSGYWLDGKFRLFTPVELALADREDDDDE